jgi:hypothetical protein
MPKKRSYREQLNESQVALIREVLQDLPHACAEFLMGNRDDDHAVGRGLATRAT